MTELINMEATVFEFRKCIQNGIKEIVKASEIYVTAIDADIEAKSMFCAKCPEIPPSAWTGFELVGRNVIDHRLLWGGGAACENMKKLPISVQQTLLDHGADILCNDGSSLKVKVENLTKDQREQIFNGSSIRDLGGQRAFIESRKSSVSTSECKPVYEVKNGKLYIYQATQISRKELARLLNEAL